MDVNPLWSEYISVLYSDVDDNEEWFSQEPLLSHYTSLQNLESMLKSDEVWLSNPLLMNDVEEVRFGINTAMTLRLQHEELNSSLRTNECREIFHTTLNGLYRMYGEEQIVDLYVMCFSEHSRNDNDGVLSMWRGYGKGGFGAAVVFDTSTLMPADEKTSFLALARVHCGTNEDRVNWINQKFDKIAEFFRRNDVEKDDLPAFAAELFSRICLFSVFSKHKSFEEEREWRLVYLKERDRNNAMTPMFGYHIGLRGLEPKLKLRVGEVGKIAGRSLSLSGLIDRIILGPTAATPIAMMAGRRMVEQLGHPELSAKLHASKIPFRDG